MSYKLSMMLLLLSGSVLTQSEYKAIGVRQKGARQVEVAGDDAVTQAKQATQAELGINVKQIDNALAEHLQLDENAVLLVEGVKAGKAADKAGLKRFDIITAVNGQKIVTLESLKKAVAQRKPGDFLVVDLLRKGQSKQLIVQLGETRVLVRAAGGQIYDIWAQDLYSVPYTKNGNSASLLYSVFEQQAGKKPSPDWVWLDGRIQPWLVILGTGKVVTPPQKTLIEQLQSEIKELHKQVARLAKLLDRLGKQEK